MGIIMNISYSMFWCVVSLCSFTSRAVSKYRKRVKIYSDTTRQKIKQDNYEVYLAMPVGKPVLYCMNNHQTGLFTVQITKGATPASL